MENKKAIPAELFDNLWDDYELFVRRVDFLVTAAYVCDGTEGVDSFSSAIELIRNQVEGKSDMLDKIQAEARNQRKSP